VCALAKILIKPANAILLSFVFGLQLENIRWVLFWVKGTCGGKEKANKQYSTIIRLVEKVSRDFSLLLIPRFQNYT